MEIIMKFVPTAATLVAAALLIGAPVFAQTTQRTQDGNPGGAGYKQHVGAPANVADNGNPGGAGYKQKVQDGNSPTTVGPGSQAYKQKTQSLSHGAAEKQN
jgi:hypothetical protein